MKILGIETSCDETALSLVEAKGNKENLSKTLEIKILGAAINSQIETHKEYGGVFPTLAKREHVKNIVPLFNSLLENTEMKISKGTKISIENQNKIKEIFNHELGLADEFVEYFSKIEKPEIDMIAVTEGPGLEPALWVGINFARALSLIWQIPVMPVNHMEGHIFSVLHKIEGSDKKEIEFPAISLLISGGHTEIVLVKDFGSYEIIGQTKDDAIGEAFDKAARLLDLPYPGGPQISKLAEEARNENFIDESIKLPRPMIHSKDFNFSFSGIKTAVLYLVKKIKEKEFFDIDEFENKTKKIIAREFEDAVTEVIYQKTVDALDAHGAKTLIIGGGVIANKKIRETFFKLKESGLNVLIPEIGLSTDNAVMVAIAGFIKSSLENPKIEPEIRASGNLTLN